MTTYEKLSYYDYNAFILEENELKLLPKNSYSLNRFLAQALIGIVKDHPLRIFVIKEFIKTIKKDEELSEDFHFYKDPYELDLIYKIINYFDNTAFSFSPTFLTLIVSLSLRNKNKVKDIYFIADKLPTPKKQFEIHKNIFANYYKTYGDEKIEELYSIKLWDKVFKDIKFFLDWNFQKNKKPIEISYLLENS